MTSIVIYGAQPSNPTGPNAQADRITGMVEAGVQLKQAYKDADTNGDGFLTDKEVETAVCSVLDFFAVAGSGFEPVLEQKVGAATNFYTIAPRANPATSKFVITNKTVPADTRNLDMNGKADKFEMPGNSYRMTTVAPLTAPNANSWQYLYDTVYGDLKQINAAGDDPMKTVNYLVATFAFTRCR